MKKPILHNWHLTEMFGVQVVVGHDESGQKIIDRVIWLSDWMLKTESRLWKLGSNPDWDWIKDLPKLKNPISKG